MVVVIILGILAAIVAPNVIGRIDDAQIARVQQDLLGIENALKFYRLDNFTYPTSEQGLQALFTKPNDPNIRNWKSGGYLNRLPKDPWGKEYQYLNPGKMVKSISTPSAATAAPVVQTLMPTSVTGNWNR